MNLTVRSRWKLAAVVVTHNRLEWLRRAVAALRAQTYPLDRIWVVDNGSTDGTAAWLATQTGLYVLTQPNAGSAGGFATVVEAARAARDLDALLLLDDDCVPDPGYVATLLEAAERLGRGPDDRACWSGWIEEPEIGEGRIFRGEPLERGFDTAAARVPYRVRDLGFPAQLVFRAALRATAPPRREFFLAGDDSEWVWRMVREGTELWMVPSARALHGARRRVVRHRFLGRTWTQELPEAGRLYYEIRNAFLGRRLRGRGRIYCALRVLPVVIEVCLISQARPGVRTAAWAGWWDGCRERWGRKTH